MKSDTSIEAVMAREELRKLLPGDICPYELLERAMSKDPQKEGYPYVSTARRQVERENQCVLEAIPNVGIKRLMPREVINRGGRDISHVKRSVRSGIRRQITVVPIESVGGLNNEERIKFHGQLAQLGVLSQFTKPTARKRIEAAVSQHAARISPAEVLALFQPQQKVAK